MQRPGAVLSRQQLQSVYGWGEVGSNAIEDHLHHLAQEAGFRLDPQRTWCRIPGQARTDAVDRAHLLDGSWRAGAGVDLVAFTTYLVTLDEMNEVFDADLKNIAQAGCVPPCRARAARGVAVALPSERDVPDDKEGRPR